MRIPGLQAFKSFSAYAFVMFFNAGISFLVFSWLTHKLTPDDIGIVSLYSSYGILLVPFISFGVQFILSVDYFKMDEHLYSAHFKNGLMIPAFMCLLITLLSIPFLQSLKATLKVNTFFILVAPFTCLLIVYNDIIVAQIRNRGLKKLYAGYALSKTFLESLFTLLLILFVVANWKGRVGGALCSLVICSFIGYRLIKYWGLHKGCLNKKDVLNIGRQGLPFIPERLAIFFLSYSDRFFIEYFKGTYDVGIYGAGAQVGTIVNLVTMALNYTFQPVIFRQLAAAIIDHKGLRNIMLAYMGFSFIITFLLIIAIPVIFRYLIGNAFREGSLYAINLTVSGFFWAVYNTFLSCLLFKKKSREIMIIAIAGAVGSIILNYINVKNFGAVGATYTNMIVYLIMAVLVIARAHTYYDLRKIFRINYGQ